MLEQLADSDIVLFPELWVTGYTCADLFGQEALLDAGDRGPSCGSPRRPRAARNWSSSACRSPSATACSTVPSRSATARFWGSFPSSSSPITRNSTRAAGSARPSAPSRPRSTWGVSACRSGSIFSSSCGAVKADRDRRQVVVGVEVCEDLWVPVPPERASGHGRSDGPAQPLGQQRDDRQEPVSRRAGRRPVGPLDRRVCDGRLRAVRVDDRRGLRRPLPDRRERPLARRVAPGRRRPADPPRLLLDHPGRRRRQAAIRPPDHDQLRRRHCRSLRPFRRIPFALADDHGGAEAGRTGHAIRARRRRRAAPSLRRDLRHPVRGARQADRTAPCRARRSTWASPAAWIPRWRSWSRS